MGQIEDSRFGHINDDKKVMAELLQTQELPNLFLTSESVNPIWSFWGEMTSSPPTVFLISSTLGSSPLSVVGNA